MLVIDAFCILLYTTTRATQHLMILYLYHCTSNFYSALFYVRMCNFAGRGIELDPISGSGRRGMRIYVVPCI